MRYVILTGQFGRGHLSAAEAIKQRLQKEEPDASVFISDVLEEIIPSVSEMIYKAFELVVGKCCRHTDSYWVPAHTVKGELAAWA